MVKMIRLRASHLRKAEESFNLSIKFYVGKGSKLIYPRGNKQAGQEALSMRIKHRLIINDIGVHFALTEPSDAVFLF